MALSYNWKQFIQRVRQHINNDFPSSEFNTSENEVLLYINEAMSFGLIGQVWNGAKVMGTMEVPEAYLVTFQLAALKQDSVTRYWYSTMPQPPLSLPLGYSVNRVYFANSSNGIGIDCLPIKAKRTGYRMNMPMPFGVRYWIENSKIWLAASNATSLLNQNCFIQMPSTRAVNVTDIMPLPDDAAKMIFDLVVARIKDRLQLPQDIIQDDLTQGNKSS
jgi:hypothetical protein